MKCVNCGKETHAGKSYRFYYGKRGETIFPPIRPPVRVIPSPGQEDAFLCNACVDLKIDTRARMIAVYAFVGTLSLAFLRLLLDPYAPYYPGDAATDWVGMSLFHWGSGYP